MAFQARISNKFRFGGQCPQTMRARCTAIRYCPDPLGIAIAAVKFLFIGEFAPHQSLPCVKGAVRTKLFDKSEFTAQQERYRAVPRRSDEHRPAVHAFAVGHADKSEFDSVSGGETERLDFFFDGIKRNGVATVEKTLYNKSNIQ